MMIPPCLEARETEIVVVGERTIALEKSGDENCWNPSKHGLQETLAVF